MFCVPGAMLDVRVNKNQFPPSGNSHSCVREQVKPSNLAAWKVLVKQYTQGSVEAHWGGRSGRLSAWVAVHSAEKETVVHTAKMPFKTQSYEVRCNRRATELALKNQQHFCSLDNQVSIPISQESFCVAFNPFFIIGIRWGPSFRKVSLDAVFIVPQIYPSVYWNNTMCTWSLSGCSRKARDLRASTRGVWRKGRGVGRVEDTIGTRGRNRGRYLVPRSQRVRVGVSGHVWREALETQLPTIWLYKARSKWTRWGYFHIFSV